MKIIALCENCQSVMKPTKVSLENKKTIEEKLNSNLDISKSQKKQEYFLEVWKCDCPKRVYMICLVE